MEDKTFLFYFFTYIFLGTRFVHTSEGRFLVTRLVPCPQCLIDAETIINNGAEEKSNDVGDKLNNIHPQLQEVCYIIIF